MTHLGHCLLVQHAQSQQVVPEAPYCEAHRHAWPCNSGRRHHLIQTEVFQVAGTALKQQQESVGKIAGWAKANAGLIVFIQLGALSSWELIWTLRT